MAAKLSCADDDGRVITSLPERTLKFVLLNSAAPFAQVRGPQVCTQLARAASCTLPWQMETWCTQPLACCVSRRPSSLPCLSLRACTMQHARRSPLDRRQAQPQALPASRRHVLAARRCWTLRGPSSWPPARSARWAPWRASSSPRPPSPWQPSAAGTWCRPAACWRCAWAWGPRGLPWTCATPAAARPTCWTSCWACCSASAGPHPRSVLAPPPPPSPRPSAP